MASRAMRSSRSVLYFHTFIERSGGRLSALPRLDDEGDPRGVHIAEMVAPEDDSGSRVTRCRTIAESALAMAFNS